MSNVKLGLEEKALFFQHGMYKYASLTLDPPLSMGLRNPP
jgi:hypothetical protein